MRDKEFIKMRKIEVGIGLGDRRIKNFIFDI